jgi:uracil-DNA glycosylase
MSSIDNTAIKLEPRWLEALESEFKQDYMVELREFLHAEHSQGKKIYPKGSEYFAAFNRTPLDEVKVVILGQDPYHGPGQAHGLCFSVRPGVAVPPSLVNIYKELAQDLGIAPAAHGCLTSWADQGVLLLNSVLTVQQAQAASHQGKGWETFTDRAINVINAECEGVVFMLWGGYAQKKGAIIDTDKHLVLKSPHPSPLSAYRGFFGSKHFSQANAYLQKRGLEPINWQLPDSAEYDLID